MLFPHQSKRSQRSKWDPRRVMINTNQILPPVTITTPIVRRNPVIAGVMIRTVQVLPLKLKIWGDRADTPTYVENIQMGSSQIRQGSPYGHTDHDTHDDHYRPNSPTHNEFHNDQDNHYRPNTPTQVENIQNHYCNGPDNPPPYEEYHSFEDHHDRDHYQDRDRRDYQDRDRRDYHDRDRRDYHDRDRRDYHDRDRRDYHQDRDRRDYHQDRDRRDYHQDRDRRDYHDRDRRGMELLHDHERDGNHKLQFDKEREEREEERYSMQVARFYDEKVRKFSGRQLPSFQWIRKFHNWLKNAVIDMAIDTLDSGELKGQVGLEVVDLACGAGGDIRKWIGRNVKRYTGFDISGISIEEAQHRYHELTLISSGNQRPVDYTAEFLWADLSQPLKDQVPAGSVQIAIMNFALHYFFQSPEALNMLLKTVVTLLQPGGLFVGTMSDAGVILRRLIHKSSYKPRGFFNERKTKKLYCLQQVTCISFWMGLL